MSSVIRAMEFATRAHAGQLRKYTNDPYIVHPAEVAGLVATFLPGDELALCAAWLHDVVEDCGVSVLDIGFAFGSDIARLVEDLTDVSKPEDGNRFARKVIDREHTQRACVRAQNVKLCDLISNTRSIAHHDSRFAKVYLGEKALLLSAMSPLANRELLALAVDMLNKARRKLRGE